MSDTPKFEVIDRRKMKAEEERESEAAACAHREAGRPRREPSPGPRLVVNEAKQGAAQESEETAEQQLTENAPAPTAEESSRAEGGLRCVSATARRPDPRAESRGGRAAAGWIRAPGATVLPERDAADGRGTEEGQRPRVDIVGARATIDLLGVLAEKTRAT